MTLVLIVILYLCWWNPLLVRSTMLGRFRSAIYNAIGNLDDEAGLSGSSSSPSHTPGRLKYRYQRPAFLKLDTDDEIQVVLDLSS